MCNAFVTIGLIYLSSIYDILRFTVDIGQMIKIAKEISMRNTHLRRFFALLMVLLITCANASAATVKAGETISMSIPIISRTLPRSMHRP